MKKILVILCLSLFLTACLSSPKVKKQDLSYKISSGMTQQQVVDILGVPSKKEIKKYGDVFIYYHSAPTVTDFLAICFGKKNRVSSMTRSSSVNFCRDYP